MSGIKETLKNKKVMIAAVVLIAIAAVSAFIPENIWNNIFIKAGLTMSKYNSAPLSAHFVDVGQGDCIIFTTDCGETILVDSGEEIKSETVIKYLKNLSVSEIDYCIVTHPHSDHYGGMLEIIKKYKTKNVYMPKINKENLPDDDYYKEFITYVKDNCNSLTFAGEGDDIKLSKVDIHFLAPISQTDDLNNMSLVFKISCGNASFLMAGDCSEYEEKDLLEKYSKDELKSNVLKIGHHGSKTATSEEWLSAVDPDICVITSGKYNSYNFPAYETTEKLEDNDITYFRTDICGNLVFDCDEKGISVR